jgi:hypothetical protein
MYESIFSGDIDCVAPLRPTKAVEECHEFVPIREEPLPASDDKLDNLRARQSVNEVGDCIAVFLPQWLHSALHGSDTLDVACEFAKLGFPPRIELRGSFEQPSFLVIQTAATHT